MYICHARVLVSRSRSRVGDVVEARNDPSTLARRRGVSDGGGESRHDPGIVEDCSARESLMIFPELVGRTIGGRVESAFCRAFAKRDATPSENDGTPVCPESLGGTGCTPMMTKGTIRGSVLLLRTFVSIEEGL
jgi:hypothetical protein